MFVYCDGDRMQFDQIPTVPTADELLDRSLRRAAAAKREKRNKDRANEEFVRAIYSSVYDKLKDLVTKFPSFDQLSPFYYQMVDILFGIDRLKQSLGAISWAADQSRSLGSEYARSMRESKDTATLRKQATARISSIVHQVDKDLVFLNEARNIMRKFPDIRDEFTVVVAGYPNVGKSSFIRLISSAEPEVASYAFTTKQIIVGHRKIGHLGRERMQIVDTPGILDRPASERNDIEQQAMNAITNVADVILFILDASEACGYRIEDQQHLLEEIEAVADEVPVVVAVNKSDIRSLEGYFNMSTSGGEGVDELVAHLLTFRVSTAMSPPEHMQ